MRKMNPLLKRSILFIFLYIKLFFSFFFRKRRAKGQKKRSSSKLDLEDSDDISSSSPPSKRRKIGATKTRKNDHKASLSSPPHNQKSMATSSKKSFDESTLPFPLRSTTHTQDLPAANIIHLEEIEVPSDPMSNKRLIGINGEKQLRDSLSSSSNPLSTISEFQICHGLPSLEFALKNSGEEEGIIEKQKEQFFANQSDWIPVLSLLDILEVNRSHLLQSIVEMMKWNLLVRTSFCVYEVIFECFFDLFKFFIDSSRKLY